MPSNINTQTDNLVGYGMDKMNPGGLIEDNDTIGQSIPKPGSFTTLTSTGGYTPAGDITLANGKAIQPDTTTAHTAVFKAYDVDGVAYKTFATLTNGNTPSFAIAAPTGGTVTIDGAVIGATTPLASTFTTISATDDIMIGNGKAIKTDTTIAHTIIFQAYDVDGTAYKTFATLTNANTPSLAITAPSGGSITIDGAVIGGNTPLAGSFTTINTTGILTTGSGKVATIRVVIAAGAVTVATTDDVIIVNKTSGAATIVNLPATPTTGTQFIVKDGKGDAASNNITLTPAAGNIDGAATYVLSVNYGAVQVVYNGTQWNII